VEIVHKAMNGISERGKLIWYVLRIALVFWWNWRNICTEVLLNGIPWLIFSFNTG
jgi:hypothetical protein